MKMLKCKAGVIEVATKRQFAEINTGKECLIIRLTNTPNFSKICYRIPRFVPRVILSKRILKAYNIQPGTLFWFDEEAEELKLPAKRNGKKLSPLDSRVAEEDGFVLPDMKTAISIVPKKIQSSRVTLKRTENFSGTHKITIAGGNNNFLCDEVAGEKEKLYSLQELKEEFGANFAQYPYDTVVYALAEKDIKYNNDDGKALRIPMSFLRKWDEDYDGKAEFYTMPDGRHFIVPCRRICEFDGEEIQPANEAIQTVDVCEECHENKDEISEVIRLISDLYENCKNISAQQQSITKQNILLNSRLAELEKIFFEK